jgi:NAD+ synthase (glutamine-hydrolysing)
MKVALAQLDYIPGDIAHNSTKIISAISYARSLDADMIVFSELAITGYPPLDLLQRSDLINASMDAVKEIALVKAFLTRHSSCMTVRSWL